MRAHASPSAISTVTIGNTRPGAAGACGGSAADTEAPAPSTAAAYPLVSWSRVAALSARSETPDMVPNPRAQTNRTKTGPTIEAGARTGRTASIGSPSDAPEEGIGSAGPQPKNTPPSILSTAAP